MTEPAGRDQVVADLSAAVNALSGAVRVTLVGGAVGGLARWLALSAAVYRGYPGGPLPDAAPIHAVAQGVLRSGGTGNQDDLIRRELAYRQIEADLANACSKIEHLRACLRYVRQECDDDELIEEIDGALHESRDEDWEKKPLPPFSGDDVACRKCGERGAFTQYVDDPIDQDEYLVRDCRRCDHRWFEACVNNAAEVAS